MTRTPDGHLEWQALLDMASEQHLPTAARTHIERCARCGAAFAEVEQLAADMRSDQTSEPPAELIRRTLALIEARPSPTRRLLESVGRLVTGFQGLELSPAGARGASAAPARKLFVVAGYEIEVELTPARDGLQLMAQVVGQGGAERPLLAWVETDGRMLRETPVSGYGTFLLEGLPDRDLDLVLETADRQLRLPLRSAR